DFYDRLQDYLLARLRNLNPEDDEITFTQAERDSVSIWRNLIYTHQTCQFNFTSYDMGHCQDTINSSSTHCDIMVHTLDDPSSPGYHPYWYACV
ncbi:hypothetical protein M422DRAFT_157710, partial [Sphaerobolus stellatus SS14]